MSGGSEAELGFVHVSPQDAAVGDAEAPWPAPRRSRLARLLPRWSAAAPAPAVAPAPQSQPLSRIPVLSLPSSTFSKPLGPEPLAGGPAPARSGSSELRLYALPPHGSSSGSGIADAWAQQPPLPSAASLCSTASKGSAVSLRSGASQEADRQPPSAGSSFACLRRPASSARPLSSCSSRSSRDSSTGGSAASSSSDLVNLLLQQAEPQAGCAPHAPLPSPAAGSEPSAAAAPAPVRHAATPNPLLQLPPAQLQHLGPPAEPALLSWRRNATLTSWHTSAEQQRRQPELLRHLLSHAGDAAAGEEEEGPASPCAPSGGAAAGSSLAAGGGAAAARGRASRRHLIALTAVLAFVVMLLHALHTRAVEQQLLRSAASAQEAAAAALLQSEAAALEAAMLRGSLAGPANGRGDAASLSGGAALLSQRDGHHVGGAAALQPHLGRALPRLHLRRRLTLLLFAQTWHGRGRGGGRKAGAADANDASGAAAAKEYLWLELRVAQSA